MATLTIRNIPEGLYARLKQSAKRHRRSVNNEVIVYLKQALTKRRRVARQGFLERARALRESTPRLFVTAEELREAKKWGRL